MLFRSDQYFRPRPNEREATHLKRGVVRVIPSVWGHIAGGGSNKRDTEFMSSQIEEFLAQG